MRQPHRIGLPLARIDCSVGGCKLPDRLKTFARAARLTESAASTTCRSHEPQVVRHNRQVHVQSTETAHVVVYTNFNCKVQESIVWKLRQLNSGGDGSNGYWFDCCPTI